MTSRLRVLDVVALLVDDHEHNLVRGQVGTIVERLGDDVFEVEFVDDAGIVYGLAALPAQALLPLRYRGARLGNTAR